MQKTVLMDNETILHKDLSKCRRLILLILLDPNILLIIVDADFDVLNFY